MCDLAVYENQILDFFSIALIPLTLYSMFMFPKKVVLLCPNSFAETG